MKRNLIAYKEIDSTNSEAARIVSDGSVAGEFFVSAEYQGSGRGQSGNRWVSDPGKNLLMSWVVYPAFLSVGQQFQLSKAVSLAISDLLDSHSIPSTIKWPNDIICNSGKVGGILIENCWQGSVIRHSIIGIGLNINQKEFPSFPYRAAGMLTEREGSYNPARIMEELIGYLESRYGQLQRGDMGLIDSDYLARLFRNGEKALFSDGSTDFTGRIRGVSEIGELIVERDRVLHAYGFHEVKMRY
jgi:BirA family transcriptional regulator, biotin operon repressor / biotin---[acetyl-CoA-carboxylase] ligase